MNSASSQNATATDATLDKMVGASPWHERGVGSTAGAVAQRPGLPCLAGLFPTCSA